jgi:hypothetical protein
MHFKACIIALFALAVGGFCTQARADGRPKIQLVVPTIDYPSERSRGLIVTGTEPFGINNLGNLTFVVLVGDTEWVGTLIDGQYSTLSQPPGTVNIAGPYDINNLNAVTGTWLNSGNEFQGFTLYNRFYTDFYVNVPTATCTVPPGINDYGARSGYYCTSSHYQAFRQIGLQATDLNVPGAKGTIAEATNDFLQTTGYFSTSVYFPVDDATCVGAGCQGVIWDQTGHPSSFVVPFLGAAATVGLGINNTGWVCGRWFDTSEKEHAFVYQPSSNQFLTYDYPNATLTTFNGINDFGYIAGHYNDSQGVAHGFIAQIVE